MVANRFQLLLNASWHDPAQSGEIVHLFAHRPMSNNPLHGLANDEHLAGIIPNFIDGRNRSSLPN